MPPAARCSSFQTSASAPTEPPPISAYSTNWPSVPAVMRPAITSCAPDHSTSVIAPKISVIATAVTSACARMRVRAVSHGDRQRVAEAAALVGFARMRLHGAHRAQGFVGQRVGVGDAVLAGARDLLQAATAEHDRQHRQRDADQRERREPRAGDEQHRDAAEHRDHAAQRDRHAGADHAAQQFGIGGQARDQLAAAVAVVEAGVERDQVRVQALAQVGDHALAEQRHEEEARRGGKRQHQRDGEQQQEGAVDGAAAALREALVDHRAERDGQAQRGRADERPAPAASRRTGRGGGARTATACAGGRWGPWRRRWKRSASFIPRIVASSGGRYGSTVVDADACTIARGIAQPV